MNSSSLLLLSIGFVLLIVQQHQANSAPMDNNAGNEIESKMEMAASLFKAFYQGNGAENDSSDKCQKCKSDAKNFDDALVKNGANIVKFFVEYVCPAAPSDKQENCLQFVKQMTQIGQELHILLSNSKKFCQAAGACSGANGASQAGLPAILFNYASLAQDFMKVKFGKSEACANCQTIVYILDLYISEYGSKLTELLLKYVCPAFPQSQQQQQCVDFVNKNLAAYLARIHEALKNPQAVCTQGGFC